MNYEYIFLDLDGTLTKSELGIYRGIIYAFNIMGIEVPGEDVLRTFIGPPVKETLKERYGLSDEEAQRGSDLFHEYYYEKGLFENELYPDTVEFLDKLKAAGKKLVIATAKTDWQAEEVLKHFGIADRIDFIAGVDRKIGRIRKFQMIDHALKTLNIADPANCIMVGDRKYDVLGAAEANMQCLGVLYGYGDRAELEEAGAAYIAETMMEAADILLG